MSSKGLTLHSLQKRILAFTVLISFIFIALFIRLFFVQIVSSEYLQKKAEDQWTRALPIVGMRGTISDANGQSLALSYSSYNVYTRAREIDSPTKTAQFLSSALGLSYAKVLEKVTDKSVSEVLIDNGVISDLAVKVHKEQLPGVYVTENSTRHYPYGDLLTQLLGFVSMDNQGQAGVELYFNEKLSGVNGYSLVQSDLTGVSIENKLEYYTPATPGNNINLTIDANLQVVVERVLEQLMVEQKAKSASCIITKTKTGEILAMSTKPSFDLNNVPRDNVANLMAMVKNQAVVDVYEPGSTFKIITMAIALETGVAKLSDTFFCPGYCMVDGEKIKCWKSIGHGSQTLAEGLANSCNCVFTTLAQRIGLNTFYEYLDKFGYGKQTGIEISGESGGILMNKQDVKVVDLARMGFGQAVAVTLLQQIMGVSAAVNGGKLYKPYFVKNITDCEGKILAENQTELLENVISAETSKIICDMLDLTVSMQTGKFTFVPGYAVGGKTGTTQKYENGAIAQGKYISSFAGVYPVNDPEYTIIISVDDPGAGAYYGSIVASPYAKMIFSEMFSLYGIKPDDPNMINQIQSFKMPNLTQMPLTKAVAELKKLNVNFEIEGEGDRVVDQFPIAGVEIYQTDTILIKTQ